MNEPFQEQHPPEDRNLPRLRVLEPEQASPEPASEAAERHVLACCLIDEGLTLARCLREKITADAFYWPRHKVIFQVLVEMQQRGASIGTVTLAEELAKRKMIDQAGGFDGVAALENVPTTAHAGYFIAELREKWVLRRLHRCGVELMEGIKTYTGGLDAFASRHALRFARWADFVTRMGRASQAEDALAARSAVLEIQAGNVDKSRQLKRGLAHADAVFLPYDVANEDWLIVIGAAPSMGKSSRKREIVAANLPAGKCFAVFLLETGKRRWLWAMAATLARVNLRTVLEDPERLMPEEKIRFNEWNDRITEWVKEGRLHVFDDIYYFEDIERTIRELDRSLREKDTARLAAAGGDVTKAVGLHGAVVDYLQLVAIREKIRMREEQVAYMSKGFKRLFKSINITGFLGSQLNRKARDEVRRPRLSDLRESGAIEQDADGVELLFKPENDSAGILQSGDRAIAEMELIQAKRRNGPADVAVSVMFHKTQTRFADAPRKGDPRPGAPMPKDGYKREDRK